MSAYHNAGPQHRAADPDTDGAAIREARIDAALVLLDSQADQ